MINQQALSADWIARVSAEHRNADKILIEKVIHALLLLEGLAKENLSFVFKGGTALMLHLDSTKRLSIDIDIIIPKVPENLEEILDNVVKNQGFLRKELQHRQTLSKIVKEHYKFYYVPFHKTKEEAEYVLLDILYEEVNYQNIVQVPVRSAFVPLTGGHILVNVPSWEDLLADKLTAFAPNTTGVPYFKHEVSMSMDICKQLYDIGHLFDLADDAGIVKATFHRFAETEFSYREKDDKNASDVLEDIFQTALCIVSRGTEGIGNFKELLEGIKRVRSYIFSESYQIDKAITHASKAAYLAMVIRHDSGVIEKFSDPAEIKDWNIDYPMSKLNRLKRSNPEAFFYWYKIFELKSRQN
jgi:predicted nucleotidyltransferase component of viral defense system